MPFNFDFFTRIWYNIYVDMEVEMNKKIGIVVGSTRQGRMSINIAT